MKSSYRLLPVILCAALAGCGSSSDLRDKLGLVHQAPDEFRVLPRPPLSVPPEFNLRPPGQESEYASGQPAENRAHDEVLGNEAGIPPQPRASTAVVPVTSGSLPSGGDAQLLSNAGAGKADPRIRQRILDDTTNGGVAHDSSYLFGGKKQEDTEVDPTKEAQRLKNDKAQNKPPTTGDTPVIAPQDKGILGDIF